ncbi:MAG: sigma-70 family RNA polymerase sigma factor, partial [Thermomicrobiales bacterium]|nr:sigma-70 family RNA polymerase sigma factor [Thermomicrobiales bacterium]
MSHLRLLDPPSMPPRQPRRTLAPALPPNGPISTEHDLLLARLAQRAIAGDRDALAVLYAAYLPRLDHWVRRACRSCYRPGADAAVDPEDVAQEAFLVFADLLLNWDGEGSLSAYLIAFFPWRLSDAVSRMMGGRRRSTAPPSLHLADDSHDADEALAILEAVASDLPDRLGRILICRIRDGMTWPEIAVEVGVD